MYHPAELKDVVQMCFLRQLLNSPHRNLCFRPQRWMKCDLQVWSLMWLFYFSLLYKKQTNIITPKTDRHHNAQNHSLYNYYLYHGNCITLYNEKKQPQYKLLKTDE